MTFDVQEYRAFLELLYKHPEWREELRQLVLTEEVLKLPELVHELTEAHKRSEARLAGVEERLTRIEQSIAELVEVQKQHEERLAKVEARLADVEERLTRLEESVAQLVEVQKQHEERLAKVEARLAKVEARLEVVEERLTRLEESVAQLVEVQKQHEERLAKVEARLADVEERLAKVEQSLIELAEAQKRTEQQVQRLTDRMGQMAGDLLEIKYRDKPSSYFGRIVRQARLVDLADVEALLGERLTDEQLFDLLQLDLVVRGQLRQPKGSRQEQPEVWLAIEVSSVVDREDVERAERRAGILRQAGLPVLAVAAGANLTLGARQLAQAKAVVLQTDGRLEFLEEALARLME